MTRLEPCSHCRGFLPRGAETCPHCARRSPVKKVCALGAAIGGGAIAFTLMACYGMPPCKDGTRNCYNHDRGDAAQAEPGPAASATPPATAPDAGK